MCKRREAGVATGLMLTDLRVKEYTISIQTHLCTGYKLAYRVREEGSVAIELMLKDPKGQKVHGQHYKLTSVLQAGVPCARGGKHAHRADNKGPQGHRVHSTVAFSN